MSSGAIDKMKGPAGAFVGDDRLKQEGKAHQLLDTGKNVVKGR